MSPARGGFRLAASVDGSLTGRGGDVIIIDDRSNRRTLPRNKREHVNEWFRNTLTRGWMTSEKAQSLSLCNAWNTMTYAGSLRRIALIGFSLTFPPLPQGRADPNRRWTIPSPSTWTTCFIQRENPNPISTIYVRELGEDIFAAQYQQCPSQPTGHLFKLDVSSAMTFADPNEVTLCHPKLGHRRQSGCAPRLFRLRTFAPGRPRQLLRHRRPKGSAALPPTESTGHCSGAKTHAEQRF